MPQPPPPKKKTCRCGQAAAKEAQRAKAAAATAARVQERARVSRPLPGWSLPALQAMDLSGCKCFGHAGLNRLLANAPQVQVQRSDRLEEGKH
jgi:hypothetical protein